MIAVGTPTGSVVNGPLCITMKSTPSADSIFVDGDDVGVVEDGHGARFLLEAGAAGRVRAQASFTRRGDTFARKPKSRS